MARIIDFRSPFINELSNYNIILVLYYTNSTGAVLITRDGNYVLHGVPDTEVLYSVTILDFKTLIRATMARTRLERLGSRSSILAGYTRRKSCLTSR